jgi:hypothetical protein
LFSNFSNIIRSKIGKSDLIYVSTKMSCIQQRSVCFLVAKLKKYSEEWTGIQSSRRTDDRLDALNTAVLPQKKKGRTKRIEKRSQLIRPNLLPKKKNTYGMQMTFRPNY